MKKVTFYNDTIRVHILVNELQKIGIDEIMVTEYFKRCFQISKFECVCTEDLIEEIRSLIHNIGNDGKSTDHSILVKEIEGNKKSVFPFM